MKHSVTKLIFFILFIWCCIIGCAYLCSSCHVLKKSSKVTSDSIHLQKLDSAVVKQSGGNSIYENDWWRNTYLFPGNTVDTGTLTIPESTVLIGRIRNPEVRTIDTVRLQTIYNTQPIAVIQEGGKNKQEVSWYEMEIAWQRMVDSLSAKIQVVNTSREVQTFTPLQLIGISMAGALFLFILQALRSFKIVKR